MFSLFKSKKLESVLDATKKIKIGGVTFTIKKINVLNYLEGSKIIQQCYDVYKSGKNNQAQDLVSEKKIKEFFSHLFVAGIVNPKISLKENDEGIFVEKLFVDWDLCMRLYEEIMLFTYGKKKTTLNTYLEKNS
jgi:hypothetical protein